MAYGELGPTHHSIEDLSWTRAIANLRRASCPPTRRRPAPPCAGRWRTPGPLYLRVPRFKVPDVTPDGRAASSPAASVRLTDGDDVTIVAVGHDGLARARGGRAACGRRDRRARDQHAVRRPAGRGTRCSTPRARRAASSPPRRRPSAAASAPRSPASSSSTSPCRCASSASAASSRPPAAPRYLLDHFGLTADGIAAPHASSSAMSRLSRMLLAIDQGTCATKAVLVDADGRDRRPRRAPVAPAHARSPAGSSSTRRRSGTACAPRSPTACADPTPAARRRRRPQHPARVAGAVGARDGRAARPDAELAGPAHGADCARLRARRAPATRSARSAGCRSTRCSPPPRRAGCSTRYDPDRARSRRGELCLGTVDSWLLSRSAASHVIEAGNAVAHAAARRARRATGTPELLELFGVPARRAAARRRLDRPVPGRCAASPPLPDGTPVCAVMGDSHAALFAHAGWRPGQVKATYGTGSSIMSLGRPAGPPIGGAVPHDRLGRRPAAATPSRATSAPPARR